MQNDLEMRDLGFSMRGEVIPALKLYTIAFCSLLPGLLLGSSILVLWYGAATLFLVQRRADRLVLVFVLWNFLNRGAYHYGLVGASEADFLLRSFNPFLMVLLAIAYGFSKRNRNDTLFTYLKFGIVLSVIAFISAIANGVPLVEFVEYYVIYFRWFIFAFLFWNLDFPAALLRRLVVLVFVITGVNSILGMLQTFVLPIQVTPTGYVPYELDVASGLLGVTLSQHLTVLCLACASFFAFRFLQSGGKSNALLVALMLVQPFSSESKFAMVMSVGLLLISVAVLLLRKQVRASVATLGPKIVFLGLLFAIGLLIYEDTTGKTLINPVSGYSGSITSLEDIGKLMGYVIVSTEIAPEGRFGSALGVGPTKFLNTVGGENTDYAGLLQIGTEANDVSSLEKQNTEVVATIGEMGWIGFGVFIALMTKIVIDCLRRVKRARGPDALAFILFECQFITATVILTFYLQGWSVAFYYVPMVIFMSYDVRYLSMMSPLRTSRKPSGV